MDKSEASSTLAEWAHLYQHGLGTPPPATPAMLGRVSAVADSTVVTTTSSPTVAGPIGSPTSQPPIEGRVGKSGRRRSRASRRAPTTLLNTDTTNFRAMVQQFTGIPSGTYFSSCQQPSNAPVSYFGLRFNDPIHQATAVMPFGHLQQQHQPQVQQQQQQQQQIYGGNIFTAGNNHSRDDIFNLQGFSNPRASLEVTDGFFLDGMSGQMGMPRPATTAIGTNRFFS